MGIRGVAQLASASGLGPEGPVFESQYPDNKKRIIIAIVLFLFLSGYTNKKRATGPSFILYQVLLSLDSCDARKHLALDGLEESAAAGRDVGHLVGKAELGAACY